MLERSGYNVFCAANGLEVVVMAATNPIDVVLLDIHLPEIDGFQVLRRLREQPKYRNLPIIALTADTSLRRGDCLNAGFTEYANKPLMRQELHRLIERALAKAVQV